MSLKGSDGGRSPSDDEKRIGGTDDKEPQYGDALSDPDAGLSEEERATLDRKLLWKLDLTLIP
ncbi:MAG: hypothetical protein M1833_006493, partial [Piccolia ochrophora]